MKKAVIFDPYLDTLGGGEFYSLSMAQFLLKKGLNVEIAWSEKDILNKIYSRFKLNFKNRVNISKDAYNILNNEKNLLKKYNFTKNYQLIFFISDGSIPFLYSKKNWLLFQAPFIDVRGQSFLNQLKLRNINLAICYSKYVKKYIDKEYKINSEVIYPPLSSQFLKLKKAKKENIILSVGRFDQIMNAKKQDVLVNVFKKMVDNGLKDWELVLIGGLMKENRYFKRLKKQIKNYPIKIMINVNFNILKSYYQKAKVYWHGAGYGQNLDLYPQRAEHFGISIVEAMACRAVPIVFKAGGVPEIVKKDQFIWKNKEELIKKTNHLINNQDLLESLSQQVYKQAAFFSQKNFFNNLSKFV